MKIVLFCGGLGMRIREYSESSVMRLSPAQLAALLEGTEWAQAGTREVERPRAAKGGGAWPSLCPTFLPRRVSTEGT